MEALISQSYFSLTDEKRESSLVKEAHSEKLPADLLLNRPCSDRTKSRVLCQYGMLHFFYNRVV